MLTEDVTRSGSLPPHWYTDSQHFNHERARIFRKGWHFVCHRNDLAMPGAYVTAQVDDQSVFVIRQDATVIRAYFNVCQHRGHELLQGNGVAARIVCPYHAWCYRLDGSLQSVSGGSSVVTRGLKDVRLAALAVDELCGLIFVNSDQDALPIDRVMPGLRADILQRVPDAARLVLLGELRGTVRANWKVAIENSLECYHCGVVHAAFCKSVNMSGYRSSDHERYHRHTGPMFEIDSFGKRLEGEYVYWHLWPLTELSVRTATPVFSVYQSRPLDACTTEMSLRTYGPVGLPQPEVTRIVNDYVVNNATDTEDVSIVESVQRGMGSLGFRGGRFVVDEARSHISEHSVHHFQKLVAAALA